MAGNSDEDLDSNSEKNAENSEADVDSNAEEFVVDLSAIVRAVVNDKGLDQKSENKLKNQKKSKKSALNTTKPSKKRRVVIPYSDSDYTCDDLSSPETFDESEIYAKPNKLPELMSNKMMSVYIKPSSSGTIIIQTGAEEELIECDTIMEEINPTIVSIESPNVDKDNSKVIGNSFSSNIESENELIGIKSTIKQETLPISTPFQAHNIGEIDENEIEVMELESSLEKETSILVQARNLGEMNSKIMGNNLLIKQQNEIELIKFKSSLEEEITVPPRDAVEDNPVLMPIDLLINSKSIPPYKAKNDEPELTRSTLMNDSNAISFNKNIIPINPNIDTDCQSDLTLTAVSSGNPNKINEKSQHFNNDLGDPTAWNMNPVIPSVELNETNEKTQDFNIDLENQTIQNLRENTAELDEINLNECIEQPVDAVFLKKDNKSIKITETDMDCGKKLKIENIEKESKSDILPTTSKAGSAKLHNDSNDNLNLTVNNLFGDISDISSDEDDSIVRSKIVNKRLHQKHTLVSLNEQTEWVESADMKIKIPRIHVDLGKDSFKVKLPNILSIDSEPFDSTLYDDEIEITGKTDEEGRERIKLKVNNTIRWRYVLNEKKEKMKETNARMVRWSDNSYTLHLGDEIYIATKMELLDDEHEYIFARQQRNFEAQAKITQKFTFRPYSTESSTHRKMTLSLADRSFNRELGTKFLSNTGKDPTLEQKIKIKEAERDLRAYERNLCRVPNVKTKRKKNINNEDNVEDGENAISIDAIKNRYKRIKPGVSVASNLINSKSNQLKPIVSNDDKSSGEESVQFNVSRMKKMNRQKAVFNLDSDEDL